MVEDRQLKKDPSASKLDITNDSYISKFQNFQAMAEERKFSAFMEERKFSTFMEETKYRESANKEDLSSIL
mgnify:CR=1 FL=1